MTREEVLKKLQDNWEEIRQRFNVADIALFGSVARDEAGPESDVDVVVRFVGKATFNGFMDLKFYLEDLLHRRVDLVTDKALRQELRPRVEREAIHVS